MRVANTDAPFATARQNAVARGDTQTQFIRGSALDLPFADDTFDVAHAHQVLQHLSRWGENQAKREGGATFRAQAGALGHSSAEIDGIVTAWRDWGAHGDAVYLIPNIELLARV